MEFAIVGVVLLVIAAGIYGWQQEMKRRKELAEWAQRHGLSFDPAHDDSMEDRLPAFSALREGSDRYAYNIMQGVFNARRVNAFDYHYETHSTDSKGRRQTHHHRFSAVVVTADLPLKALFIRTENFFDKVGELIGFDDIDFESAEFSRAFCVKAPDKRWAFDVLHQEAMEFLLQAPRYTIEMQDGLVMVWRKRTFSVVEFEEAIALAAGLLDRLPRSVVEELKASAHFLQLQTELAHTEDRIQRARRFYNANVRDLNTRIDVFPSNLIASWFAFQRRGYFEIDDASERQVPAAKLT